MLYLGLIKHVRGSKDKENAIDITQTVKTSQSASHKENKDLVVCTRIDSNHNGQQGLSFFYVLIT